MRKYDAIIFDKDGTLLDLDAFWVTVTKKVVAGILKKINREDIPMEGILEYLGIHNGISHIASVHAHGTCGEIGEKVYEFCEEYNITYHREDFIKEICDSYNRNKEAGIVKATCENLVEVLEGLKNAGIRLAVVTTDIPENTLMCLEKLGVVHLFEKIYSDDGVLPVKPDPYCAHAFSEFTGVAVERILMVGDTPTDMKFAKNAGMDVVGVAKTTENGEVIKPMATAVLPDVSYVPEFIG